VRINNIGSLVKVGENVFNEQITVAGQDFFELFDFDFVAGNREALRD